MGVALPKPRHRRDFLPLAEGAGVAVAGIILLVLLNGNYLGLTITTGIGYAVVTVGMVVQLGYSKQLAFSQSIFMALGAYAVGVFETRYSFTPAEAVVCACLAGLGASLVMGAFVTRVPSLALALSTLLMPLFLYQLATYSNFIGAYSGINGVLPLWSSDNYTTALVLSGVVCVVVLGAVSTLALRIMRSGVGLQLMALAEDEPLAESLGTSLPQRRLEVFVFGSVLATLGGALVASIQGYAGPDMLLSSAELTLLIMLYVPGSRSVLAAIVGAVAIEYLSTSSAWLTSNLSMIEGAMLIAVLLLEPAGLAAVVRMLALTIVGGAGLRSWVPWVMRRNRAA